MDGEELNAFRRSGKTLTSLVVYSHPISAGQMDGGAAPVTVRPTLLVMPEPSEIFLQNLAEFERIVRSICRRKGVSPDDADDFASEVMLRLIDDDYAAIRNFKNRSGFNTYIASLVTRLLIDYRRRTWGKWRTSADAKRLGELATAFEMLVNRDQRSMPEAFTVLKEKFPGLTPQELESLAARVPRRVSRRQVDLEEAAAVAAPASVDPVQADTARRLSEAVRCLVDRMPEEDRVIVQLHFGIGMTVAEIARSLHVRQTPLYPRLRRLLRALRSDLERAGFAAKDVGELIGADPALLDFHLKNEETRTSEGEETPAADGKKEMSK
jgi:RNA polymerase sigma factor for flagellar operon FliA